MNSLAPWAKAWTITEVALQDVQNDHRAGLKGPRDPAKWAKAECRSPFSFAKLLYIFYCFRIEYWQG